MGARVRRRGLALAEGVYSPPLLPSSYARMAQLVERLLARKVAGSIPPTRNFKKTKSGVVNYYSMLASKLKDVYWLSITVTKVTVE